MENVTAVQSELLERLRERVAGLELRWNDERGVASMLRGALMPPGEGADGAAERPEAVLDAFLKVYGPLVGPEDLADRHRFVAVERSPRGHARIRAMQIADGIPIHGATLLLFVDDKRGVFRAQSGFLRDAKAPPLEFRGQPVDVDARETALKRRLRRRLRRSESGKAFIDRTREEGFGDDREARRSFPMAAPPTHWLYPTAKGLVHAFRLNAWQPVEWLGVDGEPRETIEMADMAVDIASGRVISRGGPLGAWADVTADGRSTLQQGGSYISRALQAVREDGADRLLVNRDQSPRIVTHDAGGTESGLTTKFKNDTDISRDADGHWNATTTSCTSTDRRDSQQPETDGHFFAAEALGYYDALGWDGFDNGEWGTAPCTVRVAAHIGIDANAYFWRYIEGGRHFGYLAFYDGECSGGTLRYDFMAGDPAIFAHEYQHAVTYFGAVDSAGDPGYLETTNWHRAIHEGISDAVAGLRTEIWTMPGIWPAGACRGGADPFRHVAYPRSTDTKSGNAYVDHYDDRVGAGSPYTNSTMLSHAIFLAGQGGVHERPGRAAELIPVPGAGRDEIGEVVHYAVTELFDDIPANSTGAPCMIEAANLILDAAEEVTGSRRSCEYVMLRRAFYAVGLHPFNASHVRQTYGGEACMLPWVHSWRFSRPYLGLPAHWWRSPDLFINNGSGAEHDAEVGVENDLFARVRNIGDQALSNVTVRFHFRAHGTSLPASSTQWRPCKDSLGADCVLTIATLAAGGTNIANPDSPPAGQAVKWLLPASEVVAGLDHFCLRAEIECSAANHDHDCPAHVQSNVSYTPAATAQGLGLMVLVANWGQEPAPLELEIDAGSLPKGFGLRHEGRERLDEILLEPGKELPLKWSLEAPRDGWFPLRPPFDGAVLGKVRGERLEGELAGELVDVTVGKRSGTARAPSVAIAGRLAGEIARGRRRKRVRAGGRFEGVLHLADGRLEGTWLLWPARVRRREKAPRKLEVKGVLRPARAVHIAQRLRGEIAGGVTFVLQWPEGVG